MQTKLNCIIVDDESIAREILEVYLQKTPNITLIRSCKNVKEAIEATSKQTIDLILLDINMPEISGLTLAKIIDKKIKIIFTTAYREYAIDGFDIQAVDYLLKPISFDRFSEAITKLFNTQTLSINTNSKTLENPTLDFIFVRSDRKMVKINFKDIQYIESLSDYIKIYTTKKIIVTRETISNMEVKLPTNQFLRIHRSYIVSIAKIETYTNEFVEVNKKALPISRTYKDSLLNILNQF